MRVRAIDKDHDWLIGHETQSKAIAQNVRTAILCLFNDWFLEPDSGIKWSEYLTKNPNLTALNSDIKNAVLNVQGVVSIDSYNLVLNTERKATISLSYTDIYGQNSEVKEVAGY
ncbi:hypothetical protein [Campylobacter mucosalis]|uniref:hypothetical protein n=1 Tax=Campylobacter mucosalis TaxID=202 RepID=UPI0014703E70|nr:hypothetical protein [Campylobacter mucosalis]